MCPEKACVVHVQLWEKETADCEYSFLYLWEAGRRVLDQLWNVQRDWHKLNLSEDG